MQKACRRQEYPAYVCEYLAQFNEKVDFSQPWSDVRFIVLDTETTGNDIRKDHLLSIGAVVVQNHEIRLSESLELVIQHKEVKAEDAIAVHGLTMMDVQEGIQRESALSTLLDFIQNSVIVGHHIGFDIGMIERSIRANAKSFVMCNQVIDTLFLAQKAEHPYRSQEYFNPNDYTLDALCERYGISKADRHTAWGDALITAKLLLKLLYKMEQNKRLSLNSLL